MTPSFNILHLITHASLVVKCVMLILLAASVYGWYVIADLEQRFRRAQRDDAAFEQSFWAGTDIKSLYQTASSKAHVQGMESMFLAGFSEFVKLRQKDSSPDNTLAGTERMIRVALNRQQATLDVGTPLLASIGSVSPYVGLLGTVWGIMNAFLGLSQVQQATMASVAPGIAEALIATAIGLFAAIPAVLAYNRYTAKGEQVYAQRILFAEEFTALLQRERK